MSDVIVIEREMKGNEEGNDTIVSQTISDMALIALLSMREFQLWEMKQLVNNLYEGKSVQIKSHDTDENGHYKIWIIAPSENIITIWVGDSGIPF